MTLKISQAGGADHSRQQPPGGRSNAADSPPSSPSSPFSPAAAGSAPGVRAGPVAPTRPRHQKFLLRLTPGPGVLKLRRGPVGTRHWHGGPHFPVRCGGLRRRARSRPHAAGRAMCDGLRDKHEEPTAVGGQKGQREAGRGGTRQGLDMASGAGLTMVPRSSAHTRIPQLTPGTRGKRSRK